MSTTVDQYWNRHYRELKDTTTMPLNIGLPEPATLDPFDPEVLRVEAPTTPTTRWAKAAREIIAKEQAEERGEEQVKEQDAPSFARLAAHGVSCEVAIVEVTPEIAERYLQRQCRTRPALSC